jgi:hypothetical protein
MDIKQTVELIGSAFEAIDPTFATVGVLGLFVLVRTFLSWSIDVEINGAWPWQRAQFHKGEPPGQDEV